MEAGQNLLAETTARAIPVGKIQRSRMVACRVDTPAVQVAQIMVYHRVRYCLVENAQDEVVGIVVSRSLQRAADSPSTQAADVMLPCVTITPDEPAAAAAAKMYRNRWQHLLVVSDRPGSSAVLGIVGATDLLRLLAPKKGGR
jgi:CBS domain-containing protein